MEYFELGLDEFSDDDEEIIDFINYERRPYLRRDRSDHFQNFDDHDFFCRFRLKKQTVLEVLEQIEEQIESPTDRNGSLTPMEQLLLTLRFYATGNFLITVIGDFLNVSTACKVVKKATCAIASLSRRFIKMPHTGEELATAQHSFFRKARLPRVIGSLDCTHIKMQSPGGLQPDRKGFFSLNVQTVASANIKVLDIVARWPGSTHDQTILNNSCLYQNLHRNEYGNCLLVADSGYEDTSHIVTPLDGVHNQIEQLYNESVRRTRNPVERQYGIWKRRFPILSLGMRLKLENVQNVIVACAVLHNIAQDQNEELPPDDPEIALHGIDFDEDYQVDRLNQAPFGMNAKDILLAEYFPGLINE